MSSGRAIQRMVRQSPRKMRLVADEIRGKGVNEALATLRFSKKLAARQLAKTLRSAVANAEQAALKDNSAFDADRLVVVKCLVDMGPPLKRFTAQAPAASSAMAPPTSHQFTSPEPVTAVSIASPNTVVVSVPGSRPMAVPATTCQSFMRIAPATMLSTANGASGTRRSSVMASRPCFFSTSAMRSRRGPARRRTVSRRMCRPIHQVAADDTQMPVRL